MDNQNMPGSGAATASLVLGIVGVIVTFFINGLIGFILGIIGLAQASKAKREGYEDSGCPTIKRITASSCQKYRIHMKRRRRTKDSPHIRRIHNIFQNRDTPCSTADFFH